MAVGLGPGSGRARALLCRTRAELGQKNSARSTLYITCEAFVIVLANGALVWTFFHFDFILRKTETTGTNIRTGYLSLSTKPRKHTYMIMSFYTDLDRFWLYFGEAIDHHESGNVCVSFLGHSKPSSTLKKEIGFFF